MRKGRAGSFEVVVKGLKAADELVWSGVSKGPPRTLKWPEHKIVIDAVRALM